MGDSRKWAAEQDEEEAYRIKLEKFKKIPQEEVLSLIENLDDSFRRLVNRDLRLTSLEHSYIQNMKKILDKLRYG